MSKPILLPSYFNLNESQQSNILPPAQQKLSSSDIIALDNEKDLYEALHNILDKNIASPQKYEKTPKKKEKIGSIPKDDRQFSREIIAENENSCVNVNEAENSMRFSEKMDSFSPLQNKSLMSNINEILSIINRDDINNNSSISLLNIPEEKIEIDSKAKFNELTTHINDTLKDLQNQINLSKISTENSCNTNKETPSESPFMTPLPIKSPLTAFKRPQKNFAVTPDFTNSPQKLLKKFGFKSLLPFQEQAIDSLLAKNSCIVSKPSGSGKSTIYQIFSLLIDGIIVVVTKNHGSLKKKLEKINSFVSWGAINSSLTPEQQNHVFLLAKQKKLKLLFITPEFFNFSQFSSIFPELLVFENPNDFIENNENNNEEYAMFTKLLICPVLPMKTLRNLQKTFKIQKNIENLDLLKLENPFQREISGIVGNGNFRSSFFLNVTPSKEETKFNKSFNFNNVKWIKEDEKEKFLISLIKNNKNANFLIICSYKKNSENLCVFLNKQGLKSGIYNPNLFRNDQILISNSGDNLENQIKNMMNFVVHFDFPSNFEDYINNIANFNENCHFIGILSDIDYFSNRNFLLSGLLDKELISKFLTNFIYENNKENFAKVSVKKTNNTFVNIAQKFDTKRIITINFNEIGNEFEVKTEVLMKIMKTLGDRGYVKSIRRRAVKVGVFFRRKLEEIIGESRILKGIYLHSVNTNGRLKFIMREVENELNCSDDEILTELEKFRDRKFLTFEILEEIEHFEVCKELYDEEAIIDEIYQELSNIVLKEVEKIDLIYCILKSVISQNNERAISKNSVVKGKGITESAKKTKQQNNNNILSLCEFIQKFIDAEDFDFENFNEITKNDILPFPQFKSSRDKIPLIRDTKEIFETYFFEITGLIFNHMNLSESPFNKDSSYTMKNFEKWTKMIINIFLGLKSQASNATTLNLWKATKFWRRYYNYDYLDLKEVISETLKGRNQGNQQMNGWCNKSVSLQGQIDRAIKHKKLKMF